MARHRGNRPLMIYTSLIFIVAIAMVIVAFFGQKHLETAQLQETAEREGISARASQLSEENRLLMEKNQELTITNDTLTADNQTLTEQNAALTKEHEQNKKLYEAYQALEKSNEKKAKEILSQVYTEDLVDYQKDFYDSLVKKYN